MNKEIIVEQLQSAGFNRDQVNITIDTIALIKSHPVLYGEIAHELNQLAALRNMREQLESIGLVQASPVVKKERKKKVVTAPTMSVDKKVVTTGGKRTGGKVKGLAQNGGSAGNGEEEVDGGEKLDL